MDRKSIEAAVQKIYATRKSNDLAKTIELFAADATFEMAGAAGPGRVAARMTGAEGIAGLMQALVSAWEWREFEIIDLLIDGDRAAVRYRTTQKFIPTQQIVTTELYDLVTFRDGKIAHMVEFCDTALATDLIKEAMTLPNKA